MRFLLQVREVRDGVSLQDNKGWTALHYAAMQGMAGIVELLLQVRLEKTGQHVVGLWQNRAGRMNGCMRLTQLGLPVSWIRG